MGLLYDTAALDGAWDIAKDWTAEERDALRLAVPKEGLRAKIRGRTVREIAGQLLELSAAGLARRGHKDATGRDESAYLAPLQEIAASGITAAERMLTLYHGAWAGDVDKAYEEFKY